MRYLLLIFAGILLSACCHCPELISSSKEVTKTDSSWTKVKKDTSFTKTKIVHDTIYRSVPGPTIVIPGPCDSLCDKNGKLKSYHKESKKNGIIGTINTNTLTNTLNIDCKEDSLKHVIDSITTVNDHFKEIENNRLIREKSTQKDTVILPCPKEHRNWLDKLARWWLWISMVAVGGYALFKFGPKLLKFF